MNVREIIQTDQLRDAPWEEPVTLPRSWPKASNLMVRKTGTGRPAENPARHPATVDVGRESGRKRMCAHAQLNHLAGRQKLSHSLPSIDCTFQTVTVKTEERSSELEETRRRARWWSAARWGGKTALKNVSKLTGNDPGLDRWTVRHPCPTSWFWQLCVFWKLVLTRLGTKGAMPPAEWFWKINLCVWDSIEILCKP